MTYPGGNPGHYHHQTAMTPAPAPSPKRKPILIVAICVAVVFALANAVVVTWIVSDSGSGGNENGNGNGTQQKAASPPSGPVTPEYEVPSGFSVTSGELFSPLYPEAGALEYIIHDEEPSEALWIAPYVTTEDTTSWDESQFMAKVEDYAAKVDDESNDTGVRAEPVIGPDGESHTAYVDTLKVTNPNSGQSVTYDAYHFFDGYHLIQVGCQYDKDKEAILTGCSELMMTLKWTQ